VGSVDHLVLAAIERDANSIKDYDIERAMQLATLKLVGYTEVVHCLHPLMHDDSSIVMFGGLAKERPYPGSTTVTSVNGAVETMVRTFALELAPVRVNAIHPGIVGDSPAWADKPEVLENVTARTPIGRTITMAEVVNAVQFLLENRAVNGVNLAVDGGWIMM
jgi:NAD(P)-dependent dehydrogenase (short-subunit alcohol dehydrogenase family)